MNIRSLIFLFPVLTLCVSAQQPGEDKPPPVITMRDFERVAKDQRRAVETDLDRLHPKFRKNDPFEVTTPKGEVIKGSFQWASSNYVLVVQAGTREVRVPFSNLPFTARMRSDFELRNEQISITATVGARVILEHGGLVFETFETTDPDALAYLAACADPAALARTGKQIMKGSAKVAPDPARAVLYFEAAASLGNVDAQYALGRLHHGGFPLERNPAEAARWLCAATETYHQEASEYLNRINMSGPARQKGLDLHKELSAALVRQRKAMADDYINQWKARLAKLIQPGAPPESAKPDMDNPRNRFLILRDEGGEYYYRAGEKLHL
jgi:hypothetical protein